LTDLRKLLTITLLLCLAKTLAQQVQLYHQVNGHCDFTFIGNTLNPNENGVNSFCYTLPSSAATLNLAPGDTIESAYLYWAGSGTGDYDVLLNGQQVTASRTFGLVQSLTGFPYFAAFADVTAQLQAGGNGAYTFSGLDISNWLSPAMYCNNGGNFAGWAIVIVYQNPALPLNQVQVFDGLDYVGQGHSLIDVNLSPLNIIDNTNAKIGFLAWEGDVSLANGESLKVNGHIMSNALNPATNAFNGTNSFTGATDLYNMDLDVYDVQSAVQIGDNMANIQLTSNQDFVMVNAIVTKFNSQLPDATIVAGNADRECDSRTITLHYTVYNTNSTDVLPAQVPIAFYAGGQLLDTAMTTASIAIGGSEDGQVTLVIPDGLGLNVPVTLSVDDNGGGQGHIIELDESNNRYATEVDLLVSPTVNAVPPRVSCNLGLGRAHFDFSDYEQLIPADASNDVTFYETAEDAATAQNPILNASDYTAATTPHDIFARVSNGPCFTVTSLRLLARNCPPTIYNYVSANNDGVNDTFHIDGLHDIFLNFNLQVYNRWGQKVWEGGNDSPEWTGQVTQGWRTGNQGAPDGTYFYMLDLHDRDYPEPYTGFLYLNR
jgi:gliding motility-associated-like protein